MLETKRDEGVKTFFSFTASSEKYLLFTRADWKGSAPEYFTPNISSKIGACTLPQFVSSPSVKFKNIQSLGIGDFVYSKVIGH